MSEQNQEQRIAKLVKQVAELERLQRITDEKIKVSQVEAISQHGQILALWDLLARTGKSHSVLLTGLADSLTSNPETRAEWLEIASALHQECGDILKKLRKKKST